MKINLLPLGTVVLLKGGKKRIMIAGFGPIDENGVVYDYTGCLYPEGVISSSETLLFNHDQLESLYFNGYFDNEALEFMKKAQPLIEQAKMNNKGTIANNNVQPSNSVPDIDPHVTVNNPSITNAQPNVDVDSASGQI